MGAKGRSHRGIGARAAERTSDGAHGEEGSLELGEEEKEEVEFPAHTLWT